MDHTSSLATALHVGSTVKRGQVVGTSTRRASPWIGRFSSDPTIMAALGMLSGFCGTLMTPMAANYNLVPAAVLELKDKDGVIKVQIPTALVLQHFNIVVMATFAFPPPLKG